MDSSVFIARLIGPFLLLMGTTFLLNPGALAGVGREFVASRSMMMVAGILAFLPGLAIVNLHNIWSMEWPVIITLFGWLMVFAGIVRIGFYDQIRPLGEAMLGNTGALRIASLLLLLLGGVLSFKGYA